MYSKDYKGKRYILSPAQSLYYSMGRGLIVFKSWKQVNPETPLEFEKAVLIDFALQHPKAIEKLVPTISLIIRAHGSQKSNIGDAFAHRKFSNIREEFSEIISGLICRELIDESLDNDKFNSTAYEITQKGNQVASLYTSSLSIAFREISLELSYIWKRKNNGTLANEIRKQMQGNMSMVNELTKPFYPWLREMNNG
jgi:hypothetical protein